MNYIAIIIFILLLSGCNSKGSVSDLRNAASSGNDSKWSNFREEPDKNIGKIDHSTVGIFSDTQQNNSDK